MHWTAATCTNLQRRRPWRGRCSEPGTDTALRTRRAPALPHPRAAPRPSTTQTSLIAAALINRWRKRSLNYPKEPAARTYAERELIQCLELDQRVKHQSVNLKLFLARRRLGGGRRPWTQTVRGRRADVRVPPRAARRSFYFRVRLLSSQSCWDAQAHALTSQTLSSYC